ncbi:MAG: ATP synthase subunit C [Anaerolineales bacterium]
MFQLIAAILAGLVPMLPAAVFFLRERRQSPVRASHGLIWGLHGFNIIVGLMAAGLGLVWLATPSTVLALGFAAQATAADPYASLAAAISTGMACIGAGIAVSSTGAAAIGAIAEKPEATGRAFIFVGLAEGIAIYGLIIAFMVLNR